MATELKILNLAFRPLSDQDPEEDAGTDPAAETLDDADDDDDDTAGDDGAAKKDEDDEPDIEQ